MAYVKQRLRIISSKRSEPKRIAVSRRSIGVILINGVPHAYNLDLVYKNRIPQDPQAEEPKRKKRVIVIRRK